MYEGWTNFATWSIWQEFQENSLLSLDTYDGHCKPGLLKELVGDAIEADCDNPLTTWYALCFLEDVNWSELSSRINALEGGEK